MIRKSSHESINTQIADEAAEWFVEFSTGEPDAETRRAFDTWLRKSPEHLRAYLELFSIWDDASLLDAKRSADDAALVELARAVDTNVVPMPSASSARASALNLADASQEQHVGASKASWSAHDRRFARSGWAALAASVIMATVASGAWHYLQRGVYATGIAEQRTISLPDGSHIELNARSKIRLRYEEDERRIELLEGQALFDVAKDHKRPFIVASGATEVRAVGTLFDVYRKRSGTTVTVVEGRVAVHSKQAEPPTHEVERAVLDRAGDASTGHTAAEQASDQNRWQPGSAPRTSAAHDVDILLGAGEQLVVTQTTIDKQESPDIAAATAWRQRQLIFSATPLTEVAEEFNRYNSRQLVVLSPSLASFNVSAVFSATDQASLLRFLRAQPNIRLEESDREVRIFFHPG